MAETNDRWLSVNEICKHLGVSKDTVYKWIDKNGVPAHRMERLWKFWKILDATEVFISRLQGCHELA